MTGRKRMISQKLTVDNWLSFFAVVITILVLTASVWQGYLFRKHNQLSVRPLLELETGRERKGSDKLLTITLKNEGLGPAIIKKYTIELYGDELSQKKLYQLVKDGLCGFSSFAYLNILPKGTIVRAGDSISILGVNEYNLYCPVGDYKEGYRNFLSILVDVQYQSMYEEQITLTTKLVNIFPKLAQQLAAADAKNHVAEQ